MARGSNKPNPLKENNKRDDVTDFNHVADTSNINMSDDSNSENDSVIASVIREQKEKSNTKEYRGYYLEGKVLDALYDAVKDKQKGIGKTKGPLSNVVNRILKDQLRKEGYYKDDEEA